MSGYFDSQWGVYPPFGDPGAGHRRPHRLSGTGTTESVNASPLSKDRMHWLHVGAVAIRVSFRAEKEHAGAAVDTLTGVIIPANAIYPFRALLASDGSYGSLFVHAEAADGTSAYEASVYQRD